MKSKHSINLIAASLLLPFLITPTAAQQLNQSPASATSPPVRVAPAQTPQAASTASPTPANPAPTSMAPPPATAAPAQPPNNIPTASAHSPHTTDADAEFNTFLAEEARQKGLDPNYVNRELKNDRDKLKQLLSDIHQNVKIYQWVDVDNNIHYGKTIPDGVKAQLLNPNPSQTAQQPPESGNRQIYKWTDASGKVRYSQIRPDGIETKVLNVNAQTSPSDENSPDLARRLNTLADRMARDRQPSPKDQAQAQERAWERQKQEWELERAQAKEREQQLEREKQALQQERWTPPEPPWYPPKPRCERHGERQGDCREPLPRPEPPLGQYPDVHARPNIDVHARPF